MIVLVSFCAICMIGVSFVIHVSRLVLKIRDEEIYALVCFDRLVIIGCVLQKG